MNVHPANARPNILVVYHLAVLRAERTVPKYITNPKVIIIHPSAKVLCLSGIGNRPGFEAYQKNSVQIIPQLRIRAIIAAVNLPNSIVVLDVER